MSKRAKANTPQKYLWRKPNARHIWFRLAVPTRYRDIEGKAIIQRSTGTSLVREAAKIAAKWKYELECKWQGIDPLEAKPEK